MEGVWTAVCARFGEKMGMEVIEEFNKLNNTEKIEELKAFMMTLNPGLQELYFVSSFISGIKPEIKSLVKLSQPESVANAYEQA